MNVGGRTISGLAAGEVSALSTDAVNGAQLFASNTAIATETSQRIAADNLLDGRVDTLEATAIDFDNRLDQIGRSASSGTAVAIALSGAAFLPDKQFNLTANVGTYRGAYAGSLQIGAMISPNAAFNAGIATGFNRNGKVGARAGVTFGF